MSRPLPEAELDVLAALVRLQEATAREIREALKTIRPMAHGSVLTLLQRLEKKSLVSRRKGPVGKAFLYRSTRESVSTFSGLLESLVGRVFGGDSVALVASLFETRPPNAEELEQLRELVDRLSNESTDEEDKS